MEAAVDAAGLERFALLGISHGGPIVIAYAARHPERVSHLVLYGTHGRGRLTRSAQAREEAELLVSLVRVGWGQTNLAFRRAFTTLFVPGATPDQWTGSMSSGRRCRPLLQVGAPPSAGGS